jgi:hypothetical protein
MSWSGTMQCHVRNSTGAKITDVRVSHDWGEFSQSEDLDSIHPGDTVAVFVMDVGSGGRDLWSVRFVDSSGNCYYRSKKQCNVEESDLPGKHVVLDLGPGAQGFSVLLPVSSPCLNNKYDRC